MIIVLNNVVNASRLYRFLRSLVTVVSLLRRYSFFSSRFSSFCLLFSVDRPYIVCCAQKDRGVVSHVLHVYNVIFFTYARCGGRSDRVYSIRSRGQTLCASVSLGNRNCASQKRSIDLISPHLLCVWSLCHRRSPICGLINFEFFFSLKLEKYLQCRNTYTHGWN